MLHWAVYSCSAVAHLSQWHGSSHRAKGTVTLSPDAHLRLMTLPGTSFSELILLLGDICLLFTGIVPSMNEKHFTGSIRSGLTTALCVTAL